MKDDREIVFARIREALAAPRVHRGGAGHPPRPGAPDAPSAGGSFRAWLPPVGPERSDWIAAFRERSELLKTEFVVAPSAGLAETVRELAARHGWTRPAGHRDALVLEALSALPPSAAAPVLVDGGYETAALEGCDVGFTGCDALVAQTGSVLLSCATAGGRALSILTPHHVVLAAAARLVPDLPAALEGARARYGDRFPSMLCFETGPSRTGDIERILVLGAHGPKKLTVILVED